MTLVIGSSLNLAIIILQSQNSAVMATQWLARFCDRDYGYCLLYIVVSAQNIEFAERCTSV